MLRDAAKRRTPVCHSVHVWLKWLRYSEKTGGGVSAPAAEFWTVRSKVPRTRPD